MTFEWPLALPSIVSGLRVAVVIGVGTATIASAIGAGGLGALTLRGPEVHREGDDECNSQDHRGHGERPPHDFPRCLSSRMRE